MELREIVRRRRMCRSFSTEPVPPELLGRVLDDARRAPSAGNTQACEFLVLEGDQTAAYWDITLPSERRGSFAWPGLLRAPVLVLPVTGPDPYVARYREPDKAHTPLGGGPDRWPVPYWDVDAGFTVMQMLLTAVDVGLGACFLGVFDDEAAVCGALGIPSGRRPVGVVARGWPDGGDRPSRSTSRARRRLPEVVHRGRW